MMSTSMKAMRAFPWRYENLVRFPDSARMIVSALEGSDGLEGHGAD
jgi:hypothetical protein